MIHAAVIKYSNEKTCFFTIPKSWGYSSQHELLVFEIQKDNITAYLSCNGRTTTAVNGVDIIEINHKYCFYLGFSENDIVSVKLITRPIVNCKEAVLKAPQADGFEIIGLNKEQIEEQLMKQIRIIWNNQAFPLWIDNIEISIDVYDTQPRGFAAKLVNETVLNMYSANDIEDNNSHQQADNMSNSLTQTGYMTNFTFLRNAVMDKFCDAFSISAFNFDNEPSGQRDFSELLSETPINTILCVNPLEEHLFASECTAHPEVCLKLKGARYPLAVYISSTVLPDNGKNITKMSIARMSKCFSPLEKTESKDSNKQSKSIFGKTETTKKSSIGSSDPFDKEKCFSSSIVQVIVLTDVERSCRSCIRDELNITLESGSVIVSDCLRKMLGLGISSRVHLQSVDYVPSILNSIHFYPFSSLERSIAENISSIFASWLDSVYDESLPFIICNGTVITLPIKGSLVDFALKGIPVNDNESNTYSASKKDDELRPYWIIPINMLKIVTCQLKSVLKPVEINGTSVPCLSLCLIDNKPEGCNLDSLGGIQTVSKKGLQFLELWLNLSPISKALLPARESIATLLICGPKGGGKTALCQALCKRISQSPHHVYCHVISGRTLKGKRGETLWKSWKKSCLDVIHREPAVLVIDDLDLIIPAPTTTEEEILSDGIHFMKLVHVFLNLCDYIKSSNARVNIIATAKSVRSLHPLLTNTKGKHLFQCKIEINCPTKDQREEILKALIESKLNIRWTDLKLLQSLALKTEGCVAQDLDTLVNRAIHASWLRNDVSDAMHKQQHSEASLIEFDFDTAFQNFTPSSLQSINLHKSGNKKWSDVGGLSDVKDTLCKILLWPAKYPSLFAKCSLRLQSGILIYGPPGTGKTLIAGVLAKETGLNFIHIKGPELLSKYVGGSEQALRKTFKNAQNAKPCILFFDEFDALAPRRGHDSTGVTDRVVNQMLTQMDGVESLNGVYILAATNRPDLIDPALLRPGRLDKHIYCPMPNEVERLQILNALSRKLCLSENIDLPSIAALTSHFSGADLQALLYNAQIENIHNMQNNANQGKDTFSDSEDSMKDIGMVYFTSLEEGPVENLDPKQQRKIKNEVALIHKNIENEEQINACYADKRLSICINQDDLTVSLSKTKPSVSPTERLKYNLIYSRFGKGAVSNASSTANFGTKRVTLA